MRNKLTLYIPDTLELDEIQNLYQYKMARRFGGVTRTLGNGSWINGQAELEREPVAMLTSWFNETEQTAADVMASQFAHDLRRAGEEAIFIIRNGEALIL